MENTSWLRQTDEPLFPDVLWSRPENKRRAGKLLIIGGHQQSFSAVSEAYSAASKAGIGTARVVLPDKLQKMLSAVFPDAEYAASTHIGSFSREALAQLIDQADWADGVLLAGDLGHNSETAVALDNFISKHEGRVTLTGDSIDYFVKDAEALFDRPDTLLVASIQALQKMSRAIVLRQQDDLMQTVNKLAELTSRTKAALITIHSDKTLVAVGGKVSSTASKETEMLKLATYASVWWLQQPKLTFEALTTAVYCL